MRKLDAIKMDEGVIKLLIFIRKISLGQDETKHSVMRLVKSDMNLYTSHDRALILVEY